MSLTATCWWTLARTLALCLVAWPVCRLLERCLQDFSDAHRPWLLAGLLAPVCFPELLIGYAFRDIALASPNWAELLCSALLFVRMVPVGTIALLAGPRSRVDDAALHCRRLLLQSRTSRWRHRLELARCYWHGPILRVLPALGLMSIVAFQEFELAALLQTISWTDWFIVAQRLGLQQSEMLRQSIQPWLMQLPVLVGLVYWLQGTNRPRSSLNSGEPSISHSSWLLQFTGLGCVAGFVIAGCLIPLALIGWRTADGFVLLLRQRTQQWTLSTEIVTSGLVSVCAGLCAWTISERCKRLTIIGLLPGLFGSLLLSLACVLLFQQAWFRPAYDTPIPWVLTLTVWLLPRAAILQLWLRSRQNDESIHLAQIAEISRPGASRGVSSILWRLRDQPRMMAIGLLCYWAYCDLPTAYLLAPTGMASGLVRLYNFMHFGRSAALSAEACVFFGVPVASFSVLMALIRRWQRRN